jgi:hypothetical protein
VDHPVGHIESIRGHGLSRNSTVTKGTASHSETLDSVVTNQRLANA